MKTDAAPIPFAGSELRETRHVCAFFNSDDEQYWLLMPLIRDGFHCGDKAAHVVNPGQHHDHLTRLGAAGINTTAARERGQVEVLTNTDAYLLDGHFDQDRMLGVFEQLTSGNTPGGFPLSQIVCRMDWAADSSAHIDELVEFESRLNEVWSRHDDAVICVYELAKFSGGTVVDMIRTHPMVLLGGLVQPNPFYVPPDVFLRERRAGRGTAAAAS